MTTADTLSGLRAARALVEKGWTQGALARDQFGRAKQPYSPLATCWCLEGACDATMSRAAYDAVHDQLELEGCRNEHAWPHHWNDAPGRTQTDVLALFDRTIERLEKTAVKP